MRAIAIRRIDGPRRPTTRMVRAGDDNKEDGWAKAAKDEEGQSRQQ